ncbi:hypothetical protein SCRM01_070c [Synechococcus phage S-CRM01]|uniref:hypothetical protein n=1 Tax=Synechococcus phage S-CRM01 TaxID=1026955 RepID=UPI000209E382|nr:hypothetical protein SCRM01_070c [Synechococcus phage S-CRM01]AEC53016.1 hypothetical protein SCRM01_070c [Synechococcus phage S-CRM01]
MKDAVICGIETALETLALLESTRERSITRTKLQEALLWYQFGDQVNEDLGW